MQVLLIEPDRVLAHTYQTALTRAGHQVRIASSAQSAIFAVDEALPDSIILELQLAAHNGIEFLHELRSYSEWQHIPVIVHSLVPNAQNMRHHLSELGVVSHLYKPTTSLATLSRAITALQPV